MRKRGRKAKRPGAVGYTLLGMLLVIYAVVFKKHKLVSELPDGLKPPYIIVGNHSSFYDFVYALRALYPTRINFVVARKYFYFTGLSLVMKLGRAIPKSLFQSDTGTILSMFDILRQGGVVGIFPEGQISIGGISIDSGFTMAKFVKKAAVPVVRIRTGGAYFCNPPWAKNARKGPVESRVGLVLTKEEVIALPASAVMERLRESLYVDNYAWQESSGSLYRGGDLAMGLENILYICPRCHGEYTFKTRGDVVCCDACGVEARYGEDGHLTWGEEAYFRHIGHWHTWQIERETERIERDDDFSVSEPVELAMLREKGKGVEVVGKGTFTASREAYLYAGTLRGEGVRLVFPAAGIRYLPFDSGRNFQIYQRDLLYEFRPENPVWCMKIANICESFNVLQEKHAGTACVSLSK